MKMRTRLGYFLLAVATVLCIVAFGLAGCVAASWDSESSEELEPARTVRSIDPATGKEVVQHYAARMKTTRKRAGYTDNRAAGAMASGVLDQFGGMQGILSAIPGWGWVAALGGIGVGGKVVHKNSVRAAHLEGKEAGYEQHQIESGIIVPKGAST